MTEGMSFGDLLWTARQLAGRCRGARGRACQSLNAWRCFWASYRQMLELSPPDRRPHRANLQPIFGDDSGETWVEPVYFYQDSWAFERIVGRRPDRHVDVGSQHKFVALLSKVVPVTMVDIRPLTVTLDTLAFVEGSIVALPFEDASVPSVSSLCVVEHIGLGRYGDPLDPFGTEKALEELKRVVRPGGDLYVSVPIADQTRVHFNAHRAFREDYLVQLFAPFEIVQRRYIYGTEFVDTARGGDGVGCYHLRRGEVAG